MSDLFQHSIDVILKNQSPSGAYIASPNFPTYAYSWLRDSSFIAHAMDRVGQHDSSARFHRWVGGVVRRYSAKLDDLLALHSSGVPIDPATQMHTRFTLDGQEASDEWTNFQLDGYGTWLWALVDHVRRTEDQALYAELRPQAALVARYLAAFWPNACYDCWEEFGDKVHISTLAAIFGGLNALADYDPTAASAETALAIQEFVLKHGLRDGHLIKFIGSQLVDSSLLGAATPYRLLAPNDPRMLATIALIEAELLHGGVRRYRDDVYYGGGEWVLLAAWLGWYYVESGATDRAREVRDWVAAQADSWGDLPEQVSVALLAPEHYQPWVERWGPIAKPLLWSHAMYLVLENALGERVNG